MGKLELLSIRDG
jgi:hypothetical protein